MQIIPKHRFRFALLVLTGASLFLVVAFRFQPGRERSPLQTLSSSSSRISRLPSTILWAWERPEKLDYVDPEKVGVAFLAKTIYLRSARVVSRPRLQPLTVPAESGVIAVARIEIERAEPPTLSPQQMKDAAVEISELSNLPNVVMVQVDFDAGLTERSFYRNLLIELRRQLPPSTLLSITALASWCKGDNWLDDLPIDEAVPMLFRMGIERNQFLSQLAAGTKFSAQPCQASAGVSTDEPFAQLPPVERLYVFNPEPWSSTSINQTMETYQR